MSVLDRYVEIECEIKNHIKNIDRTMSNLNKEEVKAELFKAKSIALQAWADLKNGSIR